MFALMRICPNRTTHMDGSPGPDDDLDQDHYTSNGNQAQTDMDLDAPQDSEFSDSSGDDISGIRTDSQRLGTPTSPGQVKTVQMPATPNRRRSKRARTNKSFGADQEDCAESDCEDPSSQEEKVVCAGPGCNAMVCHSLTHFIHKLKWDRDCKYHLSCVGLDAVPTGGWFCDTDCRKNAGQRVAPVRKRRRIVVSD
jgi:hypothetical protein